MGDLKGVALPDVALVATFPFPRPLAGEVPSAAKAERGSQANTGPLRRRVAPPPLPQAGEDSRRVLLANSTINLSRIPGYAVTFIYPWTGHEEHENPQDWDVIAGAHGSTPQALEYNKLLPQFAELGASVFGLSNLRPSWQRDFAESNRLQYALLSDEQETLSGGLGLDWFKAGARQFLCRRTLISFNAVVIMDRKSIPHPEDDAGQTLALLRVLMKR